MIPFLVAGPFCKLQDALFMQQVRELNTPEDYIVQGVRFNLVEGFGCMNGTNAAVLSILLLELWGIIPPLYCVAFYYRAWRVLRIGVPARKLMAAFQRES